MSTNQNLLNTAEAAAYLRMKPQTLNKWRCLKEGPSYVKIGRMVFYKPADLDAFVNAGAVSPEAK